MSAYPYPPEDVALSLTLAVVVHSPAPLLLLDGQLDVIVASLSFCQTFEFAQTDLAGQSLSALAAGHWDISPLWDLIKTAVSGDEVVGPREMEFERPGRSPLRLIVQARRLVYLDLEQIRILVAVSYVTDAAADLALKQQALDQTNVLLQEVRHRVANSLQIIASVLLQNARKTESDETRGHLNDAHHRVMSVAALERLLSTSKEGDVEVLPYFTSLCDSISASIIGDADQVSLAVAGGGGLVDAGVSVSLGLIVTELVINALKHAFPSGRRGKITVDYNFHGPNWVLCVTDDGVGMPPAGAAVHTGLGTNIVQALAKQLNASVEIVAEQPGTKVTIHHAQIALAPDAPETASARLAPSFPSPAPSAAAERR